MQEGAWSHGHGVVHCDGREAEKQQFSGECSRRGARHLPGEAGEVLSGGRDGRYLA